MFELTNIDINIVQLRVIIAPIAIGVRILFIGLHNTGELDVQER